MAAPVIPVERAYGVTNIKHYIPFLLDIDDGNYDAWKELFLTHCQRFTFVTILWLPVQSWCDRAHAATAGGY